MPTCTSISSCDDLGAALGGAWSNPAGRGSDQVCGESDHGFDGGNNLCFGGIVDGGADTATVSTKVDQTTGQTVDVGAFEMAVSSGAREVAAWLVTSGRREKFTHTSLKGSRGQHPRNPDGFAALTISAN